jgi:hypothetical protein
MTATNRKIAASCMSVIHKVRLKHGCFRLTQPCSQTALFESVLHALRLFSLRRSRCMVRNA